MISTLVNMQQDFSLLIFANQPCIMTIIPLWEACRSCFRWWYSGLHVQDTPVQGCCYYGLTSLYLLTMKGESERPPCWELLLMVLTLFLGFLAVDDEEESVLVWLVSFLPSRGGLRLHCSWDLSGRVRFIGSDLFERKNNDQRKDENFNSLKVILNMSTNSKMIK